MAKLKPKNTIVDAVDHLDRLNSNYPELATPATKKAVDDMRRLFANPPEFATPKAGRAMPEDAEAALRALARQLLAELSLEDAIDALRNRGHRIEDARHLVDLVGNRDYIASLRREAREFQANALSLEQIASLWNDLNRPALGDEHWSARSISLLLS